MPIYTARTTDETSFPHDASVFGGKGLGLLKMARAHLPVPEALVLTTDAWRWYRKTGELPPAVQTAIAQFVTSYPDSMFSVRSGAPISMPGMMDTVLNVGVTPELDTTYPGAARRYVTSWLNIVHGIDKDRINELVTMVNARSQGDATKFRTLLTGVVQASENVAIPQVRYDQVAACVRAVFDSWDTPRAKVYRQMHDISDDMGTACVVQRMVMGTAPGFSGSGVMFSRDPATGEAKVRGEIALNAQGEEVVSGEVTPININELDAANYDKLAKLAMDLETAYGDVQDVEFTFENGKLYVLQTRVAKMSARARIVTACSLATTLNPGNLPAQLDYLKERVTRGMVAKTCVPVVDTPEAPNCTGLAASPGAVTGKVVFRSTPLHKVDKTCILVADDTAPEDFPIMAKAGAIWTAKGGFTCHSAVVARGIGVPAVVGCEALAVSGTTAAIKGFPKAITEGMEITLDGTAGGVWVGAYAVTAATPPRELNHLLNVIVQGNGAGVPADAYYRDSGMGSHVVLPLDAIEPKQVERQLARAERMREKGKVVAFCFEMQGMGEDMFAPSMAYVFDTLIENYGPDLEGETILYGVPKELHSKFASQTGAILNTEPVAVLDLLDLLGA